MNPHPVWAHFPQDGYRDWQFYSMMNKAHSVIYDETMPEFRPVMELIPFLS